MIPDKTVREILETARIEEVVEDFVILRKRGINLIGLCPFHNEKTPSFNVNPAKNVFKCFGCGKGGDAVSFLREHEHFSFHEALLWLARKYSIEVQETVRTPEMIAEAQYTDSLYIVTDFAQTFFSENLFDTDEGKSVALSYFKKRGLREETIRLFGLGFATNQKDALLKKAISIGHNVDLLKKTGLCNQAGDRDFFRDRVMFTIHNLSGKVAAFAGRTMSADKTIPKYVNSPETEIYVKNKILYGIYQAKSAIRKHDECILVEGYMDVISMYQSGIQHVVASSGTSLTEGQLNLIKRNTSNLTILYDSDPAGIKAALRGLDLALEQDLNVKIALLPEGEDPDSYVQKVGLDAFNAYLKSESRDFILFKTNLLLKETEGDPIKRAGLLRDIVTSISKIPDPLKRSAYTKECADLLQTDEKVLVGEINKIISTGLRKKAEKSSRAPEAASDSPDHGAHWPDRPPTEEYYFPPDAPVSPPTPQKVHTNKLEVTEKDIVTILIRYGNKLFPAEQMLVAEYILADIEESLGEFEQPVFGKIARECHALLLEKRFFDQSHFLNHPDDKIREIALSTVMEPFNYSHNWEAKLGYPLQNQPMPEENFEAHARAIDAFKVAKLNNMLKINLERIKLAGKEGNEEEVIKFLKIQQKLQEARNKISNNRGTVIHIL